VAAPLEVFETDAGDVSVPARSGGTVELADADLDGYLRLHSGIARGHTRSLLMPWSELRTLARRMKQDSRLAAASRVPNECDETARFSPS
jgi:hypothetical protein